MQAAGKHARDWRAASWHVRVCPCPQGLQAAELRELSAGTRCLQKPARENVLLQIRTAALDSSGWAQQHYYADSFKFSPANTPNPGTTSATILQLPTPQPPSW